MSDTTNTDTQHKFSHLSPERYEQLQKAGKTNDDIIDLINDWGCEQVNKGYGIFEFSNTRMLEICRIDEVGAFESDEQAVEAAIKDGVKIIPVAELPETFDRLYLGWIDTPENRREIETYAKIYAYECLENRLENLYGESNKILLTKLVQILEKTAKNSPVSTINAKLLTEDEYNSLKAKNEAYDELVKASKNLIITDNESLISFALRFIDVNTDIKKSVSKEDI